MYYAEIWHHGKFEEGGLNPENPDRDDGAEHGEAGNRPARHVRGVIGCRSLHHGIAPLGHDRLLQCTLETMLRPARSSVGSTGHALVSRGGGAGGADQPVGLLQGVAVGRLLADQKTDRYKQRTAHQADQHDLAVRSPVGVVK